ncbi:MAG: ABC transporter substrate-binding protein [Methylococcales bacterium]|nr:ABC transporter substrate-binding protein [Methylococcales bacterium]
MKSRFFLLIVTSIFFTIGMNTAEAKPATAKQVVVRFQSTVLKVMKQGKKLGFEGRYKRLEKAINDSHDLTKITRVVIGREWGNLSEPQQQQLIAVFTKLSIATYAFNFKEFSGEAFHFDSEEKTTRGGMIIHTHLSIPNDKKVTFDYMLKEKKGQWGIINVIANGVSDLALKRSEYTKVLKNQGFDILLLTLNEKIKTYEK